MEGQELVGEHKVQTPSGIGLGVLVAISIIFVLICSGMAWAHWNEQYVDAKIINKYVDLETFGGYQTPTTTKPHYDVYTDKGVFEIGTPAIDRVFNEGIFGMDPRNAKINYDLIQNGKSYRFHMYGYRMGILDVYPIVTDFKEE